MHIEVCKVGQVRYLAQVFQGAWTTPLPHTACLSGEDKERIREFVMEGGAVVASFESGRYRPEGEPAEDNFLRELLGVEEEEYIRVREGFGSFGPGELISRPTYALQVLPGGRRGHGGISGCHQPTLRSA